jgi:chemotaxis protein CheD
MNCLVYNLHKRRNALTRRRGNWTANTWVASTIVPVERDTCRIAVAGERLLARHVSSDIALAICMPGRGFAALVRFSLPDRKQAADGESFVNLWANAETAIPTLVDSLRTLSLEFGELSACAVGGASERANGASESANKDEHYIPSLGRRNEIALRRILWRQGILLRGQDLGGNCAKSLWLETATGRAIVRTDARHAKS